MNAPELSPELLPSLLGSLDEGALLLDARRHVLAAGRGLPALLGREGQELTGLPLEKLLPRGFAPPETGSAVLPVQDGRELLLRLRALPDSGGLTLLLFSDPAALREAADQASPSPFAGLLGGCPAMQRVRGQAQQIAAYPVPVLLTGENGTGRSTLAQALHEASPRRDSLFLTVDCGAFPASQLESELFGQERNPSRDASPGKLELCGDGTLFLNNIGALPLPVQAKLLRVLETGQLTRVGGHTAVPASPRLIVSGDRLEARLRDGSFREDLFYRLSVVTISLPPLRERGTDVLLLARYFLRQFCQSYRRAIDGFSQEAEALLLHYSFPGNVRELRNLVEFAVLFCQESQISGELLLPRLQPDDRHPQQTLSHLTRQFERRVIQSRLLETGVTTEGKIAAAQQLGISIATLYRKLGEEE